MKITDETRKYWAEKSAAILDAYDKGLINTKDPLEKAQIDWAKQSTAEKEAALNGADSIIDRWQAEADAMADTDDEDTEKGAK